MSEEFNNKSKITWQAYSAISGLTGGTVIGVLGLALYLKPESSGWWLVPAILGGLTAAGSIYSFASLLRQEIKDSRNNDRPNDPKP